MACNQIINDNTTNERSKVNYYIMKPLWLLILCYAGACHLKLRYDEFWYVTWVMFVDGLAFTNESALEAGMTDGGTAKSDMFCTAVPKVDWSPVTHSNMIYSLGT